MKLRELVEEALRVSPEFKRKLSYRVNTVKKPIQQEWLLDQLLKVFGQEYLSKAMEDNLKGTKHES
jgi:hypothetical protein